MRKVIFMMAMLLTTMVCAAKNIKTVVLTTNPQMHCASCETKIKGNLRFEKGVKEIATSVPDQTVTITYDADKTNETTLIAAFSKFGYTAKKVETTATDAPKPACQGAKGHCGKKNPAGGCGGCHKKKVEEGTAAGGGCCGGAANGCPKKKVEEGCGGNAGGCGSCPKQK